MAGSRWRHAVFMMLDMGLRAVVVPHWRAALLRLFGARIGRNVRVYACRFINLEQGFANLSVGDDVHVGTECLIDLKGPVDIGAASTLGPRVTVISHSDPGAAHDSPLVAHFPPEARGVRIGAACWIGAGAMLLSGTVLGDRVVVGAQSLVRGTLAGDAIYAGNPAALIRPLGAAPTDTR